MKLAPAATAVAVGLTAFAGTAGIASARTTAHVHHGRAAPQAAVFVQTDNTAGNHVAVYARGADGRLSDQRLYATGGKGGILAGSQVDHLSSQGSLRYLPSSHMLLAVNAGSNTVTAFKVDGTKLTRTQVIASGGKFPVSITASGRTVYVLNALDGGNVHGYRIDGDKLRAIAGSTRDLGLNPAATPQFVATPGQVAFTPNGRHLLVTTKANTNAVDVFSVTRSGKLSHSPHVNTLAGDVPFAIAFTGKDDVNIGEAGPDAVQSFKLSSNGQLTSIDTLATGGQATCWLITDGHDLFAGNAGSASESEIADTAGHLTLTGTASTDAGTVDATTADSGRYVYVQTGAAGIVDEFRVTAAGTLHALGTVAVPHAVGGEGIAASR